MRITVLTGGSAGDVFPYIALGLGLQDVGHKVRIVTNDFEDAIRSRGLEYTALPGSYHEFLASKEGQAAVYGGGSLKVKLNSLGIAVQTLRQALSPCWSACQDADMVIYTPLTFAGYHMAETLGIPSYQAHYLPVTPTSAFPSLLFPVRLPLGRSPLYNKLTHILAEESFWQLYRFSVNTWLRDTLKCAPLPRRNQRNTLYKQKRPVLYAYSSHVLPRPADWGDWIHVTGYWFLDHPADWSPPSDLVDFLESGSPPIYVGFGSMHIPHAEETTRQVVQALCRTKQRGILLSSQGGLCQSDLPENIFQIETIPHSWLFPRVASAIHHGGTSTLAMALRSGIPSITIPASYDQYFWSKRCFELGVGTRPIPYRELSTERLVNAIRAVSQDQDMKARAHVLGRCIREECGVKRAIEVIHHHLPD
jgi:sterol 3beta-glucosyltransferase